MTWSFAITVGKRLRDFLYKFFRPCLDLVIFVITEQIIPHNERKFEQIFVVKGERLIGERHLKRNGKSFHYGEDP